MSCVECGERFTHNTRMGHVYLCYECLWEDWQELKLKEKLQGWKERHG